MSKASRRKARRHKGRNYRTTTADTLTEYPIVKGEARGWQVRRTDIQSGEVRIGERLPRHSRYWTGTETHKVRKVKPAPVTQRNTLSPEMRATLTRAQSAMAVSSAGWDQDNR